MNREEFMEELVSLKNEADAEFTSNEDVIWSYPPMTPKSEYLKNSLLNELIKYYRHMHNCVIINSFPVPTGVLMLNNSVSDIYRELKPKCEQLFLDINPVDFLNFVIDVNTTAEKEVFNFVEILKTHIEEMSK